MGVFRTGESPSLAAFAIYLTISLVGFGLPVIAARGNAHVGYGSDPSAMMWCMVWWPYAIAHHLNPFVTRAIWAPSGYNLTWATSIPALALAFAPLTLALGPVAAYNAAAVLAPALSAWAGFALCRQVSGNLRAAIVGGFLYGFSPYEVGHVLGGHLVLTANFIPPLCVLLFLRMLDGSVTRHWFAIAFAVALVLQCLISTEVLATMTVFGTIALVCAAALIPAERSSMLRAIVPIAAAYLMAAIVLSPFLYYAFGAGALPRQPFFPASYFSTDLLSFVIPTPLMLLAPHAATALASRFSGNLVENGFYIGLPLLGLMALYLWPRRHQPLARLLVLLLVVIAIAALGPELHVDGRVIATVPWAAAYRLPLLKHALPVRLANYAFIILALIVSIWISESSAHLRYVLAAYALAALLPNPVLLLSGSHYVQPTFFAHGMYRKFLRPGEDVMVFPYGVNGASMLWQAESWNYFNMPGGYLGVTPDVFRQWPAVGSALFRLRMAQPALQLDAFVRAHRTRAIIVADGASDAGRSLVSSLGLKPIRVGGVSLYRIRPHKVRTQPGIDVRRLEIAADYYRAEQLLGAASCFMARGGNLAYLNPDTLHRAGLLSDSKWAPSLRLVLAGASHGAITGLWVGAGKSGAVALGMFAPPAAAAALVARYGAGATKILYPYPRPYDADAPSDEQGVKFILMMLRQDFVTGSRTGDGCGSGAMPSQR